MFFMFTFVHIYLKYRIECKSVKGKIYVHFVELVKLGINKILVNRRDITSAYAYKFAKS